MHSHIDTAIAFIERCETHNTLSPLISDFSHAIASFGFQYFMMTRLPAIGEDAEPYIVAHTWPKEWLNRYREARYFWHDPVSMYSFTSPRPFSWKEARNGSRRTRIASQISSEAKSIGLFDGLGFPVGDASCVQAVVSLGADQTVHLETISRSMLHLVCLHAEMRAVEIQEKTRAAFARITEREREVLRWTANGKSATDVGVIMDLSERTVKGHLANARQKLQASTTTHAVAKALKTRQIIL